MRRQPSLLPAHILVADCPRLCQYGIPADHDERVGLLLQSWSVQEVQEVPPWRSSARAVARFSATVTQRGCTLVVRGTLVTGGDNWTTGPWFRRCFRGPSLVLITPSGAMLTLALMHTHIGHLHV